jgi:hypothetical protein
MRFSSDRNPHVFSLGEIGTRLISRGLSREREYQLLSFPGQNLRHWLLNEMMTMLISPDDA